MLLASPLILPYSYSVTRTFVVHRVSGTNVQSDKLLAIKISYYCLVGN